MRDGSGVGSRDDGGAGDETVGPSGILETPYKRADKKQGFAVLSL